MNGRKAPASLPRTIIAMPGQGADLGIKKAHDISQLWPPPRRDPFFLLV